MKLHRLSALAPLAAAITASVATAQEKSPHFDSVVQHLELGGESFRYVDVAGDPAAVGRWADEVIALVGEITGSDEVPPIVGDMVGALGLDGVEAFGSSTKTAGGRTVVRGFTKTGSRRGLLTLIGTEARPFSSAASAPAGSDWVLELELDLRAMRPIGDAFVEAMGKPEIEDGWEQLLGQAAEPLPMDVGTLMSELHTRLVVVMRLDPEATLEIPDAPVEVPAFEAAVRLEDVAWLVEGLAGEIPEDAIEKGDGFWKMALPPLPPDAPFMQPVLHFDTVSGHLTAATSAAFLDEVLAGTGGLWAEPGFQAATAPLPKEGNFFTYVSPRFGEKYTALLTDVMESAPDLDAAAREGILRLYGGGVPADIAAASAALDDGVLSVSTAPEGGQVMTPGAVWGAAAVGFMAGVSVPVFQRVQERAQEMQDLSQLKMVGMGLRVWAIDNDGVYPDDLEAIVDDLGTAEPLRLRGPGGLLRTPFYVRGLHDASRADTILLASPWSRDGKRAVVFSDGSGILMEEEQFEFHLMRTLETEGTELVEPETLEP